MTSQLEPLLLPYSSRPAWAPVPTAAPSVPPRRTVPVFAPIRRGSGGRHRLRQAVRHRPGVVVAGLLAASTTLTAGPLRVGPPPAVVAGPAMAGPAAAGPAPAARQSGAPPQPQGASTTRRRIHP
ncbi:hypothetical protein [Kitasatospora sp. McL0602]|uniref:hypothetical protein n=1 Tax=Kitasatospora sp. McL0602 TaxID=3439530 RepID=UPI003F8AB901